MCEKRREGGGKHCKSKRKKSKVRKKTTGERKEGRMKLCEVGEGEKERERK